MAAMAQTAAHEPPAPKVAVLRATWAAGDHIGALRIAANFPVLGSHKAAIMRGWNAHLRPAFYQQLGQDPAALVQAGLAALRERYRLPEPRTTP